jgi:hypothetical protein
MSGEDSVDRGALRKPMCKVRTSASSVEPRARCEGISYAALRTPHVFFAFETKNGDDRTSPQSGVRETRIA